MPEGQAMPFGILEQHRHEALRGRKIAGQERNRTGALSECVAQRDGMIQGDRFFDTSLGGRYRLIRVPLEPEDRREPRTGRHPWIELEADDVELVNGGRGPSSIRSMWRLACVWSPRKCSAN